MQKASVVSAVGCALVATVLTSCSFLQSIFGTQLTLSNLSIATSGGIFTGVTVTVKNVGLKDFTALDYRVVLSSTSTVDPAGSYPATYAAKVSLPGGKGTTIAVTPTDVAKYELSNTTPVDGNYYVGLIVDTANVTGKGPFSTTMSSQTPFLNVARAKYKLSGSISAQSYTSSYYGLCTSCARLFISDATCTVYYGLIAATGNYTTSTPASENLGPDQVFLPGWGSLQANYTSGFSGAPNVLGAPGTGSFVLAAFIDWHGDGKISTDSNSEIVDPIGMPNYVDGDGVVTTKFSSDSAGEDLIFPSAPN